MLGAMAELTEELEQETFKEPPYWGHPCIFKEGFTWDLERPGANPCMYQSKFGGWEVYRLKVCWDAGNTSYASFLTKKGWQRSTGYIFGEEKNGGPCGVHVRPRMRAPATSRECTGC